MILHQHTVAEPARRHVQLRDPPSRKAARRFSATFTPSPRLATEPSLSARRRLATPMRHADHTRREGCPGQLLYRQDGAVVGLRFRSPHLHPAALRGCPSRGRQDTYGVLMIGGIQYTRRCRECWHSDHYPLPPLEKKVIYLDQMVISHMTKALHPTAAAGREIDPFWRELFEKLDRGLQDAARDLPGHGDSTRGVGGMDAPGGAAAHVRALLHGVSFHDTPTVRRGAADGVLRELAHRPPDGPRSRRTATP